MFKDNIKVVFLFTTGRNGSMLFQSLFDSYDNILTIPVALDSYTCYKTFISLPHEDGIKFLTSKTNLRLILNKVDTRESGKFKEMNIDSNTFVSLLDSLLKKEKNLTTKTFFQILNYCYAKSINKDIDKIELILEHTHFFPFDFTKRIYDYPNCKFIHMFRNPKASFLSYYASLTNINKNSIFDNELYGILKLEDWIMVLETAIYGTVFIYRMEKNDNYKVIKLEDLYNDIKVILDKIELFFEISFNKKEIKSTLGGLPYISDSAIANSVYGVSNNKSLYK